MILKGNNKPLFVIIAVLLIVIAIIGSKRKETKTVTTIKRDTVTVVKFDTVYDKKPVYVTRLVTDTVYKNSPVFNNNGYLLREIKTYKGTFYKALVSGIEPSLDEIEIYNKQIDRVITVTQKQKIYINQTNLYLVTGFEKINNSYSPNIGLSLTTGNGFLVNGKIGIFDSKPIYGVSVGYKLFK